MSDVITEIQFELYRPFVGAVVFLLGAIVGSFLNVLIYRLPKIMEQDWRNQCTLLLFPRTEMPLKGQALGLALPASHCPHCQHTIRWWENIPLISYLIFLQGKCAGCGSKISVQYPLVEAASALMSVAVILHFGPTLAGFSALLLTWTLLALAVIDLNTQLLPDDLTLPLLWAGLLLNLTNAGLAPLEDAVIGAMAGYLSLWTVYWVFKILTGKEGMGFGDFKLLAAFGAWLGWQAIPTIILLSSVVGSIVGIALILFKGRDSQIPVPFGPYLALAGWIALIARDQVQNFIPALAF